MLKSILIISFTAMAFSSAIASKIIDYVNPFIGTGAIEGGLSGNNYPGASMPFGMIQLSPDTHSAPDWFNASGYDHNDSIIYGFSHTRLSGTGASDLIDLLIMPTTGNARLSTFSHDEEKASPGYYKVRLADEDIISELSATTRAGIHRYSYPDNVSRNLWIDLDHSAQKGSWDRRIINAQIRQVSPTRIEGYRIITGWAKLRNVYFVIDFSEPIEDITLFDGEDRVYSKHDATLINGRSPRALLSFGKSDGTPLIVKAAVSPVSTENARLNMETEALSFDFGKYVELAETSWENELSKITAKGNPTKLTTFYTALYHTMLQPNTFSDVNGEWMTPVYSVGQLPEGETQYTTFSLWDTYRAAHPLYTIINPEKTKDFVNSMLRHYDYYGYLPIWHLWGQDNYCMIGNHSIPVITDAVLKGIEGINPLHAWEAVKNSSTCSHPNSPFGIWEKYGYMPENIQSQSVSITLEMAYDDWCASLIASAVGDKDSEKKFSNRSTYYKNLYNPSNHFFAPKNDKGEWIEPFDPLKYGANGGNPFTEGNAWQYYWYVPHDIYGLIALTGGDKAFEKKLDDFFTITDSSGEKNDNISGLIGQYAHGNEPSHHVAYLYNYIGKPEKSAAMVKKIMTELYNNNYNGYAGNDDCGEMSAWFVFSAMGFYPVDPSSGIYNVGYPLLDGYIINLPSGKKFNVEVKGDIEKGKRIKKLILNGKHIKDNIIKHKDIVNGGNLTFFIE